MPVRYTLWWEKVTDKRDEANSDMYCIVKGQYYSVFVFSCRIHFSVVVDNNTAFQKVGKKEKWRLAPWSANDVIAATAVMYCCGSHTHVDRESRYERHDRRKPDLDNKQ